MTRSEQALVGQIRNALLEHPDVLSLGAYILANDVIRRFGCSWSVATRSIHEALRARGPA